MSESDHQKVIAAFDQQNSTVDVNDPMLAAAIHHLGEAQNFKALEATLDRIGKRVDASGGNTDPSLAARTLAQTLGKNAPGLFSGGQIAAIGRGDVAVRDNDGNYVGRQKYSDTVQDNLAKGTMSADKLSTANGSIIAEASRMASGTSERAQKAQKLLKTQANLVLNDSILKTRISKIQGNVESFSRGTNGYNQPWNG